MGGRSGVCQRPTFGVDPVDERARDIVFAQVFVDHATMQAALSRPDGAGHQPGNGCTGMPDGMVQSCAEAASHARPQDPPEPRGADLRGSACRPPGSCETAGNGTFAGPAVDEDDVFGAMQPDDGFQRNRVDPRSRMMLIRSGGRRAPSPRVPGAAARQAAGPRAQTRPARCPARCKRHSAPAPGTAPPKPCGRRSAAARGRKGAGARRWAPARGRSFPSSVLIRLDQTFLLLDVGDAHPHVLQQDMHIVGA